MSQEIEYKLQRGGVTPTSVRVLVYKVLDSSDIPVSLSDIEIALDTVDKSTISRTLSTFKENHLVHSINDGSGSVKYELCRSHGLAMHDDLHVHFRCLECGTTSCLTNIRIHEIELPAGYEIREKSFIVTGICALCNKKKKDE